jgi:PAS domain S-box-containing protein
MNPMSIQIVDKDGYTINGNQAFVDLFGIMPPADFSIFKDLESKGLGDTVQRAKRGEVVHQPVIRYNVHEIYPQLPDNPVWIKAVLFPLKDSNNTPERFVFMHENVTENKQAEIALRESEEKYKQIFDNTFDIMSIYEVTEDGRYKVVDFNAAEAKLIGPVEYYQNRYIDDCIPPELYDQFKQNYERCIAEGKLIVYDEDVVFQDIIKSFNTQLIPLKNSSGRIHRIIVISRDITDIKLLNTQLTFQNEKLNILNKDLNSAKLHAEESDRLKSAFLANMSHEIRTPMNGILGFARLLKDQRLSGDEQQDYISIIEKSGDRMLNTINDIVNISKIEAGQVDINITNTNINEQTEFIYNFFRPESERKGLQLMLNNSLPAKESIIKTDTEKVYSILTNLVNNAIKFTKKGSVEFGYILKTASDVGEALEPKELEFYVKDTGVGISEEQIELIFERFRQTSDSLTRNFEGSGLGLPISKAYVEMLGGKIWVKSSPDGSLFYFTLPYNTEHEVNNIIVNDASVSDASINDRERKISNLKILIVEDDEISEKLIMIGVKRFSREILIARTGTEAIEACRSNPDIDLILMDMKMPEMDGYEATRQIRQFNKGVVIVAQTAFAMFQDRQKVLDAGCNDYFQKPISGEQLMALTQKYFFE